MKDNKKYFFNWSVIGRDSKGERYILTRQKEITKEDATRIWDMPSANVTGWVTISKIGEEDKQEEDIRWLEGLKEDTPRGIR